MVHDARTEYLPCEATNKVTIQKAIQSSKVEQIVVNMAFTFQLLMIILLG